jgi:beta-N-acetylhexosaminidase
VTQVDRLAAGCLLPSFPGVVVPEWVRRWLERGLGGITLFSYNVRDAGGLAELTGALRADAPQLLVATDEEGGDVTRLEAARGSSYPGNYALGVVDDVELTRAVAGAIARDLARAGVNLNLAPVADLNSNPRNPVIGVRSFGAEPELVARHVAAFVEGTQLQGVAACAKHFPGHGDTAEDSHRELPVVQGELEPALAPFRAAIAAGVRAVMTGHLVVPAFGGEPATVSRRLVGGLLRGELGFCGLVLSDALEMRGLSGSVGVEEGAVRALAAGVDALCLGHDVREDAVESVHAALVAAVRSGRLPLDRVAEAAARVGETAAWASAAATDAPGADVGLEAARRALRVHGEARVDRPPLVVELVPEANLAAGEAEHGLADVWPGAVGVQLHRPVADVRMLADKQPGRPLVVVVRDAARHGWQREAVHELLAVLAPPTVIVEVGLPGWHPPPSIPFVETAGAGRANLLAAAERLRA